MPTRKSRAFGSKRALKETPSSSPEESTTPSATCMNETDMDWNEWFKHVYKENIMMDVDFLVGPEEAKLLASRFVLALRSPVFREFFKGPGKHQEVVRVPDARQDVFRRMLKFVYTDILEADDDTAVDLVLLARRYKMVGLEQHVLNYVRTHLNISNVRNLYDGISHQHIEPSLRERLIDIAIGNPEKVFLSQVFDRLSHENVLTTVSRACAGVAEIDIFRAANQWAEFNCRRKQLAPSSVNKKNQLGNVLHAIRFPLMNMENFKAGPAQSGLLNNEEIENVLSTRSGNLLPTDSIFPTDRRKFGCSGGVLVYNQSRSNLKTSIQSNVLRYNLSAHSVVAQTQWQLKVNWGIWLGTSEWDYETRVTIHPLAAATKFHDYVIHKGSVIELVNSDPEKSIRRILSIDQCPGEWTEMEVIKYRHLMNPRNGFIRNKRITVKVELMASQVNK